MVGVPGAVDSSNMLPDPSTLTTVAIDKAIKAERHRTEADIKAAMYRHDSDIEHMKGDHRVILQRIADIDRASQLLAKTVDKVPTETDLKTGQLQKLMDEKITAIYTVLTEREKQARATAVLIDTALQAALKARQDTSIQQNEALEKSIAVSAQATKESIIKNEQVAANANGAAIQLATNGLAALELRYNELKDTVGELRIDIRGLVQNRSGGAATLQQLIAIISTLAAIAFGLYAVTKH